MSLILDSLCKLWHLQFLELLNMLNKHMRNEADVILILFGMNYNPFFNSLLENY